jgi:regulator of cell morphogenesis and NO signaling
MPVIDPARTVAELAVERPGRVRIFERLGLEYCCGGRRPLEEACRASGLDTPTVVAMLEAVESADGDVRDWAAAPLDELVDHVVEVHHAYLRDELPRLSELVAKVADRHGELDPRLAVVRETFEQLHDDVFDHIEVEELVVFPAARRAAAHEPVEASLLEAAVEEAEAEHARVGAALALLREATDGYRPPEAACPSWRGLLDRLATLEADLHEHVHEENNILFPRALELTHTS